MNKKDTEKKMKGKCSACLKRKPFIRERENLCEDCWYKRELNRLENEEEKSWAKITTPKIRKEKNV